MHCIATKSLVFALTLGTLISACDGDNAPYGAAPHLVTAGRTNGSSDASDAGADASNGALGPASMMNTVDAGGGSNGGNGGNGGDAGAAAVNGSAKCAQCHRAIYTQWTDSMHAHALTTPTMVTQTNQDLMGAFVDAPNADSTKFCINCHGPQVAAAASTPNLPQALPGGEEGVSCTSCHHFDGDPSIGNGGFASGYQKGIVAGGTNFGNLDAPTANPFHQSSTGRAFADPNLLCQSCHEVWLDRNENGVIEKGVDLVLQTTWDEYVDYKTAGGTETCVSCHLPEVPGLRKAADSSTIETPERVVHDHSFRGVDYALDGTSMLQAEAASRAAILRSGARVRIEAAQNGGVDVLVANTGAGHNLPTGFAFARQMWIEFTVSDGGGSPVFTSGVLGSVTDDLCDGDALRDPTNPLRGQFQNCPDVDEPLVTFQQKLVDRIEPLRDNTGAFVLDGAGLTQAVASADAVETPLQFLRGGVVPRVRTSDATKLGPLAPFEERRFHYDAGVAGQHVTARLLFRALPPYFLRALSMGQARGEAPLAPLIGNLEVIEIGRDDVQL
jgi:hypothetical protein